MFELKQNCQVTGHDLLTYSLTDTAFYIVQGWSQFKTYATNLITMLILIVLIHNCKSYEFIALKFLHSDYLTRIILNKDNL